MTKGQEYVKFHLPLRYFQSVTCTNGMSRDSCLRVLCEAFDIDRNRALDTLDRNRDSGGFDVICTAEQFARFIIWRHQLGNCINGIRDLAPTFVCEAEARIDSRLIAKRTISCRTAVKLSYVSQVLDALDSWSMYNDMDCSVLNVVTDR